MTSLIILINDTGTKCLPYVQMAAKQTQSVSTNAEGKWKGCAFGCEELIHGILEVVALIS